MLEIRNTGTEMENAFDGSVNWTQQRKNICKFEDISVETFITKGKMNKDRKQSGISNNWAHYKSGNICVMGMSEEE